MFLILQKKKKLAYDICLRLWEIKNLNFFFQKNIFVFFEKNLCHAKVHHRRKVMPLTRNQKVCHKQIVKEYTDKNFGQKLLCHEVEILSESNCQ